MGGIQWTFVLQMKKEGNACSLLDLPNSTHFQIKILLTSAIQIENTHLSKFLSTCNFRRQGSVRRLPPVCRTKYDGKIRAPLLSSAALEYSRGRLSAAKMSMSCRSTTMQSSRHTCSSTWTQGKREWRKRGPERAGPEQKHKAKGSSFCHGKMSRTVCRRQLGVQKSPFWQRPPCPKPHVLDTSCLLSSTPSKHYAPFPQYPSVSLPLLSETLTEVNGVMTKLT